MNNPSGYLLSIIIPAFNNAELIVSTLSSLQRKITDEVEIIIVNDGSTDETEQRIVEFYQSNPNPNVKYFCQDNLGVAIARNVGLENASGKYIAFVDSDDVISPDYFNILLPKLKNERYDIVEFKLTRNMDELQGFNLYRDCPINEQVIALSDQGLSLLTPTFRASQWHLVTKVFRRSIIGSDRFEEHRRYEDIMFCPFQYFKCSTILKIENYLYFYRVNKSGITENIKESDARHIFFAMNKMCHYISQNSEKKILGTLMIVNCFLEARKILRKKKGYYCYETDMIDNIQTALRYCDAGVIEKKVIFKMKYIAIDTFVSSVRYRLLKACKVLLPGKGI
ncbi:MULTISPECIES: glycosyltransferase family 2 protein [Tenebrionibacter/Tenebrionicola group]|jgi:glycosyltransferase involved in cell wall biosynthesis|uniref:Glycosyltransferase family 2 protein n=2 Tax=Tenebrionibacter/Tenebrionicola group TaxID=2969848 RepID=A0A8K0V3E3_9ENTR|nr:MULTISPECIES: glycosyltransferase family A protein [Tenebrionibacter/Tenebrionicola group]MBK4714374.1 glycosyltransferase family 2 protein [Tenebrionibacter intestinalis]MBV5095219.1 glycosyltransferase family 2 protein [Tenebrionicola larvae]